MDYTVKQSSSIWEREWAETARHTSGTTTNVLQHAQHRGDIVPVYQKLYHGILYLVFNEANMTSIVLTLYETMNPLHE